MRQKLLGEFFGTAFLLMIVVGSGIMGESLAQGNTAIALLANSIATGAGLYVLIQCLGEVSGAHFNPVVSAVMAGRGKLSKKEFFGYWASQFSGAILGVFLTHVMFGTSVLQISSKDRFAPHLWISEVIATFGLISVITLTNKKESAPLTIASYIAAAYWFTSSTSFANPAVTLARMFSDTFAGIHPNSMIPFFAAQALGATIAYFVFRTPRNTLGQIKPRAKNDLRSPEIQH